MASWRDNEEAGADRGCTAGAEVTAGGSAGADAGVDTATGACMASAAIPEAICTPTPPAETYGDEDVGVGAAAERTGTTSKSNGAS